ncbi:Fic/DOC family protein [uncultured archaeon]|nr:Fic/DOC family protein [uncultured archaeon]
MFVEKRVHGKSIKYYLVYSYREKGIVKKERKYLGQDLDKTELEAKTNIAKQEISQTISKFTTQIFSFSLTKNQVEKLNASSKIKIVHFNEKEWQAFTETFVYNTNAIEGSTVQENEVREILREKRAFDVEEKETRGVAKAVDYIRNTKEEFSVELIKKLHDLCFHETKSYAGQFRNVGVVVKNSRGEVVHRGIHYSEVKSSLEKMTIWYEKNKLNFKPLVLAAIIHNEFENIHPFEDGNGRVGRLLLNFILLKNNYPPINVKLQDRMKYYSTLQEYSKNKNIKPTIIFLITQYKKTLKQVTTNK